jgi:ATP-dependent RNA helicase DeaD
MTNIEPTKLFGDWGLPPQLAASLVRMNYTTPTPIQSQAIPLAMQGRDILGTAQTGTGKTAAFGIPLVARLLGSPRGSALVLTPTRELAAQVIDIIQQLLGPHSPIQAALIIGGDSMPKQIAQLRGRPRIIVGTPGRINDHLERGTLMLHETQFLVLDESDRMLDMGFGAQIEKIARFLPQSRQTLMFSATLPNEIIKMSAKYLNNPERIAVGSTNQPLLRIQQEVLHVSEGGKYEELLKQLNQREGSIILFVKTKRGADRMADRLNKQKLMADALHGDLHQRQRDRIIQGFRDKKYRILVATDIACRGLDIPHIEHVINYDLPQCPEDYIHRIGRTARAGAEGAAICLITPQDGEKWRDIHKLLHPGEPMPPMPRMPAAMMGRSGQPQQHSGNGKPGGNSRRRFRSRSRRSGGEQRAQA